MVCLRSAKSEVRSSKSETNSKREIQVRDSDSRRLGLILRLWLLGFVSDFGIRISGFLLAGQVAQTLASRRQFGLLDDQHRKAVLDRELEPAALAHEPVLLQRQLRMAGIHRATQNGEKIGANHGPPK